MKLLLILFYSLMQVVAGIYPEWTPHSSLPAAAPFGQKHFSNIATSAAPQLPAFHLVTEDGKVVTLSQWRGKKVFVNLWATWCPPCRAELSSIQKLYQSVDTSKAVFILISLDKDFATARSFKRFKKIKLPIYYPAENLPDLFNVPGIPTTFIFNEKGELVQQIEGGENYNTKEYKLLLNS